MRFFRLAERRIAEQTGRGLVCYISNFSYLQDPSFVVMRQKFLAEFDSLWFDNMNGDSRETGKRTPDGKPDPSVFSTRFNHAGIRVGTAIGLLVRNDNNEKSPIVRYREFWGSNKRADLLGTLNEQASKFESAYARVTSSEVNRYMFRPETMSADYRSWPAVSELGEVSPMLGMNENRRGALFDIEKEKLVLRLRSYYDTSLSIDDLARHVPGLVMNAAGFDAAITRKRLLSESGFDTANVRRSWTKPFDLRWTYVESVGNLWNRSRPELLHQSRQPNEFLLLRRSASVARDGAAFFYSKHLADQHVLNTDAYFAPVWLLNKSVNDPDTSQQNFKLVDNDGDGRRPNLSVSSINYLASCEALEQPLSPEILERGGVNLWLHVLAVGYSPKYLAENADGFKQDWARVPLPDSKELLRDSAALGRRIADLLDTESPIDRVTSGDTRPELRRVGVLSTVDGQALPKSGLRLEAGWGHHGSREVVMPGSGKYIEREWSSEERDAIVEGTTAQGMDSDTAFAQLGETCLEIYLNDDVYWSGIPKSVWEYRIGGYQVIKKWLSYREHSVLGRDLSEDEARYVRDMARRLTAIVLLQPSLDENYLRVKENTYEWKISPVTHPR